MSRRNVALTCACQRHDVQMKFTLGEGRIFNFVHAQVILAMITTPPQKRPLSRKSSHHPHRGGFRIRKGSNPESSSSDNANNPSISPSILSSLAGFAISDTSAGAASLSSSANLLFPAILCINRTDGRRTLFGEDFAQLRAHTHTHEEERREIERGRRGWITRWPHKIMIDVIPSSAPIHETSPQIHCRQSSIDRGEVGEELCKFR